MENNDFEKRMELLKKSYDRIPSSFNTEEVLRKIEEESSKPPNEKPIVKKSGDFRQKVTVWAVSLASIFIIGFLTATFLLTEKRELAENADDEITEQFLLQLEESYKEERNKRQEMLKMEDDKFDDLSFIRLADDRMNFLMKNEFSKRIIPSRKEMEIEIERIIEGLKLPSEMVTELLKNSRMEKEAASISFMSEYRDKVLTLILVYNETLNEHYEVLKEYKTGEEYDVGKIILGSNFPVELQNIIDTMETQNIRLAYNNYRGYLFTEYFYPEAYEEISSSLHENVRGYLDMIINEPYMAGAWLKDPPDISADYVIDLQNTLLKVTRDTNLYPAMYGYYSFLFFDLVKGSEYTPVFDVDGVIKPEYQLVWKRFSRGIGAIPTAYLMGSIVEEMEATGWRRSKSWDEFNFDKIRKAMELARDGKLEAFMEGGTKDVKDEKVSMPDENFNAAVIALYEEYVKEQNSNVLRDAKAVEIIGLYYYTEELQDYETQHALFLGPEYEYYIEKDEYVQSAKESSNPEFKFDEYFSELNYMDDVGVDENGNKFGSVFVLVNEVSFPWVDPLQGFWMKETEEGWRIILTPNF